MEIIRELLPGAHLIKIFRHGDARGAFTKTFHAEDLRRLDIDFTPREICYSASADGVVRGMHFQLPPHGQRKLIHCISGSVLDVLLDLRKNSPVFGQAAAVELSAAEPLMLHVPVGVAHGFTALEPGSRLLYQMDAVHHPQSDAGVRWDSFGFNWPVKNPVISARDQTHPPLPAFDSPFTL